MLKVLPDGRGTAAENMILDWQLLAARGAGDAAAYLRHYGWKGASWTFGYSQRLDQVLAEPEAREVVLCRRPTGGGIVDHRDDWTWALAVPVAHPLAQGHAREAYPVVHQALGRALRRCGGAVRGFSQPELALGAPFRCFAEPQGADLADEAGHKTAGAAIKKTREGLLLQGSVSRSGFPKLNWGALRDAFAEELAKALNYAEWQHLRSLPDFDADKAESIRARVDHPDWNPLR